MPFSFRVSHTLVTRTPIGKGPIRCLHARTVKFCSCKINTINYELGYMLIVSITNLITHIYVNHQVDVLVIILLSTEMHLYLLWVTSKSLNRTIGAKAEIRTSEGTTDTGHSTAQVWQETGVTRDNWHQCKGHRIEDWQIHAVGSAMCMRTLYNQCSLRFSK